MKRAAVFVLMLSFLQLLLLRINHNERLEFLGDAVVEFLTR